MSELMIAVIKAIKANRKYYMTSDRTLLNECHEFKWKIRYINERVFQCVDDAHIFYRKNDTLTYDQIFQIIDIVCGTQLKKEWSELNA